MISERKFSMKSDLNFPFHAKEKKNPENFTKHSTEGMKNENSKTEAPNSLCLRLTCRPL